MSNEFEKLVRQFQPGAREDDVRRAVTILGFAEKLRMLSQSQLTGNAVCVSPRDYKVYWETVVDAALTQMVLKELGERPYVGDRVDITLRGARVEHVNEAAAYDQRILSVRAPGGLEFEMLDGPDVVKVQPKEGT